MKKRVLMWACDPQSPEGHGLLGQFGFSWSPRFDGSHQGAGRAAPMTRYHGADGLDIGIIRHAQGFSRRQRWSSRNYYCADIGGRDRIACIRMVSAGHMVEGRFINRGRDQIYHVTQAGAAHAGVANKVRAEDRIA